MISFSIKVLDIETINEVDGAWSPEDYMELLDRFNFNETGDTSPDELREFLFMAISDLEPSEAAEIILSYGLSDRLSKGQIQNLSEEMIDDKVAEEYSDISLHYPLFNINQLLYKAYNGTFPNTKASRIQMEITFQHGPGPEITKEFVLKALCSGLSDKNLIRRLFADQLSGEVEFPEAEHIIWELEQTETGAISLITSDYWVNDDDLTDNEFEGVVHEFEKD